MQKQQVITSYDDLIKQWFKKSQFESDFFTKFIFLYISFTAFLAQKYPRMTDRETINNLKLDEDTRSLYMLLIRYNPELRATIQELVSKLRKQPIENDTRRNDHNWRGTDGEVRDVTDWENIIEYWYRVRNNLFHGRKAPGFQRDRMLVKYAYLTLTPLMQHFIEDDLSWTID